MEARKNRQEKRQRPYRTYCKPYNEQRQQGDKWNKPQLKNKLKPAQELEVKQIMENFNCEYDDIVEAVDLYNLDVEECTTAWLAVRYNPQDYFVSKDATDEICIVDEF